MGRWIELRRDAKTLPIWASRHCNVASTISAISLTADGKGLGVRSDNASETSLRVTLT